MSNKIDPKFKEWACSFSGCDGGNPKAPLWICGIEWGGDKDPDKYYKEVLPNEISKGKFEPDPAYDWEGTLDTRYGQNVAKLYCSINDLDYSVFIKKQKTGMEIFKLNLYPIKFRNTDKIWWEKYKIDTLTGFKNKYSYSTWCFLNRFPVFSKGVLENNPKLIIGTGVGFLTDFFACFAGNNALDTAINFDEIKATSVMRSYYWAKLKNGTVIFIIPFFSSANGLNSDDLIEEMGKTIKNILLIS